MCLSILQTFNKSFLFLSWPVKAIPDLFSLSLLHFSCLQFIQMTMLEGCCSYNNQWTWFGLLLLFLLLTTVLLLNMANMSSKGPVSWAHSENLSKATAPHSPPPSFYSVSKFQNIYNCIRYKEHKFAFTWNYNQKNPISVWWEWMYNKLNKTDGFITWLLTWNRIKKMRKRII